MKIRVLLADDHTIVRFGLRMLLETADDIVVVAEARDGREAVEMAAQHKPTVAVMDIIMPHLNGLDAARVIHLQSPRTRTLMLSTSAQDDFLQGAVAAQVAGYMTKESAGLELLQGIRTVVSGKRFFGARVSRRFIELAADRLPGRGIKLGSTPLSARECEVLQLVAEGETNRGVAEKLQISVKTIEKHRQSVMDKLNIHHTAGLTRYAINRGMVRPLSSWDEPNTAT